MSLVFAGVCSHAPGITGRAHLADPATRDAFHAAFRDMGARLEAARPDAVIVIAAEHFANFFMNNMPAYAIGMADHYEGPIEDPAWLGIERHRIPGNAELSRRLIAEVMQTVDVAFAEEWKFDHGIMVPLHFLTPAYDKDIIPVNINCQGPPLTPLHRAWAFARACARRPSASPSWARAASRTGRPRPTRARSTGNGTSSSWTAGAATTGTRCCRTPTPRPTATAARAASRSAASSPWPPRGAGQVLYCQPIPIFAVSCTAATMEVA